MTVPLKSRRWFLNEELLAWREAVARREYAGNLFEWPYRGVEWPQAPIVIGIPTALWGRYA